MISDHVDNLRNDHSKNRGNRKANTKQKRYGSDNTDDSHVKEGTEGMITLPNGTTLCAKDSTLKNIMTMINNKKNLI